MPSLFLLFQEYIKMTDFVPHYLNVVSPLPGENATDARMLDVILFGEFCNYTAWLALSFFQNFLYLFVAQFGSTIFLTFIIYATFFRKHILSIFTRCSFKQVIRIDAFSIITSMTNFQMVKFFARIIMPVRSSVSAFAQIFSLKLISRFINQTVTVDCLTSLPKPTFINSCDFNFFKKDFKRTVTGFLSHILILPLFTIAIKAQNQDIYIGKDFAAHKVCWLLRTDIIVSHAIGDGLTGICYYLIPVLLIYATRKYKFDWTLTFIFFVYAGFILLCGTTHILDVIMIYHISESLIVFDGWLRIATGLFSLFSVAVTVWALQMFLTIINKLFVVTGKINAERKKFGKASQETINEYNEVISEAKAFLQSKETIQFESE